MPDFLDPTIHATELLDPFIDAKGKRWYDLTSAAKHLSPGFSIGALQTWMERGRTSFGLPIETIRLPIRTTFRNPDTVRPRKDRPVISEDSLIVLDAIYSEVFGNRRKQPGGYTKEEKAKLQEAARRPHLQMTLWNPLSHP